MNELIEAGYNPTKCNDYRKIYNQLFAPKKASTCNCSCAEIFNNIKSKLENEVKTKNQNQTKNAKGQFEKVEPKVEVAPVQQELSSAVFIQQVKQELIEGYLDPENILKAYRLAVNQPDGLANMKVMKTTILNYEVKN